MKLYFKRIVHTENDLVGDFYSILFCLWNKAFISETEGGSR